MLSRLWCACRTPLVIPLFNKLSSSVMKQSNSSILVTAVLAVATFAGCQPKGTSPATSTEAAESVPLGPQYSKKGLLVPEDTRLSLNVRVVEVTEQKVSATLELSLRVYQSGGSGGKASGTVTSEQARSLHAGQLVEMELAEGLSFTGKIVRLNDELEKATGTIEVLVEFTSAPQPVSAGTFLKSSVSLDTDASVVSIPSAGLLQCSDGYSVFAVSGEHLVRTPVKVGAIGAGFVEIKDGLYVGDQVVLQPVMSLWMTELAAVKGGQACCVQPAKRK